MAKKTFGMSRYFCSALLATALLAGCGGASKSSLPTLSGMAAVGLPVVGGRVDVNCASGRNMTATTSSSGNWTVTTTGQTLPCTVRVTGGTVNGVINTTPYHSIAFTFGNVNITPLTDLALAQLLGTTPANWFSTPDFTGVNASSLAAALAQVTTGLGMDTTLDVSTTDPFTAAFVPQRGVLLDDVLEAIKTTLLNIGKDYATLLAASAQGDFATNFAGFSAGFGAAYTSLSGAAAPTSGVTSCASTETLLIFKSTTSGQYTNGQGVCFTASTTGLSFLTKALLNPTADTSATQGNFVVNVFADTDTYTYQVFLNSGALYEINVYDAGTPVGAFILPVAPSGSV